MLKIFPSALAVVVFLLCPASAVPDPEDFPKAWRNMSGLLINEGWKGRAPEAQRKNWQALSAKVFADYAKQYLKITSADEAYLGAMGVDHGLQKDFFLTLGNFIVFFEGCFDWAKTQRCSQENSIPLVNTFIQDIMPVVQPTFDAHMDFYFTHFPPPVPPSQIDYIYWKGQALCIADTLDTRSPRKWIVFKKLENGGVYLSALYPFGSPLSGPEGRPLHETYIPYSHGYKVEEMQPGLNDRFLVCFQSETPQIIHDSGLIVCREGHNPSFWHVYGYTGKRAFPPYAPYTTSPRIHMKCLETVEQVRQEERLLATLQEQVAKAGGVSPLHLLKGCIDNTPGLLPHPGGVIHRSVFLNPQGQHVASQYLSALLNTDAPRVFIPYPETPVDLWESLLGCLYDASSESTSAPPPLLLLQYVQSILEAHPPLDRGSCSSEEDTIPAVPPPAVFSEELSVEGLKTRCREHLLAAYQKKWEHNIRAEQEERSQRVKDGSHYQPKSGLNRSQRKKGKPGSKKHQLREDPLLGAGHKPLREGALRDQSRQNALEELRIFQATLEEKKQTQWKFRKFTQLLGGAFKILESLGVTVEQIHTSGSHTRIKGPGFSATVVIPHGGDDVVSRGTITSLGKILSFAFDHLFNQEESRSCHPPAPPGF
jgi:predicted RNA binding protein YcfA (HicA-like mRNA interferase family)